MENKIMPEQIEKAKSCKTVEELLALAKENEIELTEAEATNYFAKLNPENCELADNELETVAGGDCLDGVFCPVGMIPEKKTDTSLNRSAQNAEKSSLLQKTDQI